MTGKDPIFDAALVDPTILFFIFKRFLSSLFGLIKSIPQYEVKSLQAQI